MDWNLDTIRQTVLDKIQEIDNSNFKFKAEPQRVEYLISVIDGIKSRGDKVLKGDEDVTSKFLNALENMITDPMSRILMYTLKPITKEELLMMNEGYECKPLFIHPSSSYFSIVYLPSKEEVGRTCLSNSGGECLISFIELKGEWKHKLFLYEVMADALQDFYGKVTFTFGKDFNGVVVKKYEQYNPDGLDYARPKPGYKRAVGRCKKGATKPEDPFYRL